MKKIKAQTDTSHDSSLTEKPILFTYKSHIQKNKKKTKIRQCPIS